MIEISTFSKNIRIEMFSLGHIDSIGWFEVVASHDVVDIVDSSRSHSNFSEVRWPYSSICIFALIL